MSNIARNLGAFKPQREDLEDLDYWTVDDIAKLPEPEWLIDGWLREKKLTELYSLPKVGKTFLAKDWVMSMTAGISWLGHKVKPGRVVYIYAEDPDEIKGRMDAWFEEHGWHLRDRVRATSAWFRARSA